MIVNDHPNTLKFFKRINWITKSLIRIQRKLFTPLTLQLCERSPTCRLFLTPILRLDSDGMNFRGQEGMRRNGLLFRLLTIKKSLHLYRKRVPIVCVLKSSCVNDPIRSSFSRLQQPRFSSPIRLLGPSHKVETLGRIRNESVYPVFVSRRSGTEPLYPVC